MQGSTNEATGGADAAAPGGTRQTPALLILGSGGTVLTCSSEGLFACADRDVVDTPIRRWIPGLRIRETTPGYNVAYALYTFAGGTWHTYSAVAADGRRLWVDISLRVTRFADGACRLLALVRRAADVPFAVAPLDAVGMQGA
jgi:hypothetical protein